MEKKSTQTYIDLTTRCLKDFNVCESLNELTATQEKKRFSIEYKPKN